MANYNPYEPPRARGADIAFDGTDTDRDPGDVPAPILELMRQTKPWVTFLAILGFLGTGFMVLFGLFVLAAGGFAGLPAPLGLVYIVLAAIYLFPALHLLRYGSSIGRLTNDPRMERLRVAIEHQKSFWKFVGIMAAVMLALYPIIIVIALVIGFTSAATHHR